MPGPNVHLNITALMLVRHVDGFCGALCPRSLTGQKLWLRLQEDAAAVVEQWLAAAQLAQVGMDRLVGTLELIEGAHRFHSSRLQHSAPLM